MADASDTSKKTPLTVVVDGEIGAGKTTLIELLRAEFANRGLVVAVVPEPVEEWKRVGILQEFYADKPAELRGSVAYDFQTYTFTTRIQATCEVVESHPDADIYLLERSVLTDRFIFMELQRELMGPMRVEMYEEWWAMWSRLMPLAIAPGECCMVYLKPALENCQARVGRRARVGEVRAGGESADAVDKQASARGGVSYQYQRRLREAHEAYLQGWHSGKFPEIPPRPFSLETDVLVVEGALADADFSVPGPAAETVARHIADHVLK